MAEASGEIESEDEVLVIRRIHVDYRLRIAKEHRETAERVHDMHADFCPVARSIRDSIVITTALHFADR